MFRRVEWQCVPDPFILRLLLLVYSTRWRSCPHPCTRRCLGTQPSPGQRRCYPESWPDRALWTQFSRFSVPKAFPRLPSLLIWGFLSMFLVLVVPHVLCVCCLLPVAWFVWLLLPVGMTQCVTGGGKLGRAWLHRRLPSAALEARWHRCLRGFCFPKAFSFS